MSLLKRRAVSLLLVLMLLLTVAFIWGNSMMDSESSAEISGGLLDRLTPMLDMLGIEPEDDIWLRKLAHFCEFGLLGTELALLSLLHCKRSWPSFFACTVPALLVAVADETIQIFSGRYSHVQDVLLDLFGAVCGIAGIFILTNLYEKHKSRKI